MSNARYFYAGANAGPLASGAFYAPGEDVPASAVNPDDAHDAGLLESGVLVDTQPAKGEKEKGA